MESNFRFDVWRGNFTYSAVAFCWVWKHDGSLNARMTWRRGCCFHWNDGDDGWRERIHAYF